MVRSLVLAAICASACAPTGPQQLQIVSKGGPLVAVIVINDAEVARVGCNGGIVLTPQEGRAPALPWNLKVFDQRAGRTMLTERITELPRWLVIFQDSAGVSASPILGPVIPCASSAADRSSL